MSVFVKDFEIPRSCSECPLINGISQYCILSTKPIPDDIANCKRADFCKLVDIKKPHGRLIDAEELSVKLGIEEDCLICDREITECKKDRRYTVADICRILYYAHTVLRGEE